MSMSWRCAVSRFLVVATLGVAGWLFWLTWGAEVLW